MSFADDVHSVLLKLVDLLESERVPYMIMGGIAVSIWGIPRATYDIDVTLSVDESELLRAMTACRDAGFAIDPPFERGFRDVLAGMQKITIEWWTPAPRRVEVDVFLVTTDYQRAAFARRVRARLEGREAWVLSPADLILHKLIAGRPKDLADIQNLLAVQGVPDRDYLEACAADLGVGEELRTALAQAELQ
jgi:hypothetical protein